MTDDLRRLRREYASRAQRLSDSDIYSPLNPAHQLMIQHRARDLLDLLRRAGVADLAGCRVLEVGCGSGSVLHEMFGYGVAPDALHGIDLLFDRLQLARRRLPAAARVSCADGQRLPYADHSFDLVLQFTALSSILDERIKANVAAEMQRVLRPGGRMVWYDFWLNPANDQTQGISPATVKGYFPGCTFLNRRVTLAPPITRRLVHFSWGLCALLEKLRIFNTHYLMVIQKPV